MNRQIWRWTLTKDAVAPCFVRDVLAMRQNSSKDADFFWLGHTPCRTVLLVGMVVGIQVYDKRTIYTIDDGTAVIDCVVRHPHQTIPAVVSRSPQRSNGGPGPKPNPQRPSPKRLRLDKTKLEATEPPPPITEPGHPVRIVGRVARQYQSKQIFADTIELCTSSLDEIAHLEHVIDLHKTKYSLAIPFVPPPNPASRIPPPDSSAITNADLSVFSNTSPSEASTAQYSLPPPPMPMPLQNRNGPPIEQQLDSSHNVHTHVPSSPTALSITSSTPSSPCKLSSPVKTHEVQRKPKLRHPSRLHTRDLTANTFRLYVKHYMDNAPPLPVLLSSPRSTCGALITPTKHVRDGDGGDESTPRPRASASDETCDEGEDGQTLGFTMSHLRRVPELALLAARVVRAEARKRDKADRERQRGSTHSRLPSSSSVPTKLDESKNGNNSVADPPHKKMKRLFSWAVVKLYEEGSIVLWNEDVRPLPVPPPHVIPGHLNQDDSGLWKVDGTRSIGDPSYSLSTSADLSASVLYTSSASASLYSHYHAPRRTGHRVGDEHNADADFGYVSDPMMDEEAYIPLTPRLLAEYVRGALDALQHARGGRGVKGKRTVPTPENLLAYLQRTDTRWARVGVWAVEEALAVLKE